jgi:hypothetical protein
VRPRAAFLRAVPPGGLTRGRGRDLDDTALSGTLPSDIGNLEQLETLCAPRAAFLAVPPGADTRTRQVAVQHGAVWHAAERHRQPDAARVLVRPRAAFLAVPPPGADPRTRQVSVRHGAVRHAAERHQQARAAGVLVRPRAAFLAVPPGG